MEIKTIVTDFFDANVYVFQTGGKTVMIDCGGYSLSEPEPDFILLTHGHIDHISSLHRYPGAAVFVSEQDKHFLTAPEYNLSEVLTGTEYIYSNPIKTYRDLPDYLGIRVIETPGHTPGSVVLQKDDVLFTGDTLFAGGIGNTGFPLGNAAAMQKSLQKLATLSADFTVYPGHGEATTIGREFYGE